MDEKEQTTQGEAVSDSISKENTAEISLGDRKVTIHRLRAGKFYEILNIYTEMVKEITPIAGKEAGKDGEVSWNELLGGMFQKWPNKMIEFIAVAASSNPENKEITIDFIKGDAYPEQITEAFDTCFKLNRVAENLKNFAAPMKALAEGSAEEK